MDEIYELLQQAQEQLSQRNDYALTGPSPELYPYQKADIDFFLEGLPLDTDDHQGITFVNQLLTIREQLAEASGLTDADILTILFDYEADLTKFLLLAFAEEKIDFSNVLYLYIVQKVKPIVRSTISRVERVNLHWLLASKALDSIIIPPSFVEKYQTQLQSDDPSVVYWFTRLLFLDDYAKKLRPLLEENQRTHFDWRIRVYSAQRLGKSDQISPADRQKLERSPGFEEELQYG